MNNIEHLVGRFCLNTDRVLDCVLHALELHSDNKLLLQYLARESKATITQILGFKFQGFRAKKSTSVSLYKLVIVLLENEIIDLNLLMPHLSPNLEATVEKRYQIEKEERDAATALLKHYLNEDDSEKQKRQELERKAVDR
eukprot:UN17874